MKGVDKIEKDIKRINGVLKKDSDIQFGIITFFINKYYKDDVVTKTETFIKENIFDRIDYKNKKLYYQSIIKENNEIGYAVTILFKKP